MKKYYYGYIVTQESIDNSFKIADDNKYGIFSLDFQRIINSLSTYDKELLENYFKTAKNNHYNSNYFLIDNESVIDVLNSLDFDINYKYNKTYGNRIEILYSIVTDEKGNKYAQEYKTGRLFPLYDKTTIDRKYYFKSEYNTYPLNARYYYLDIKDFINNSCFHRIGSIVLFERNASIYDIENYEFDFTRLSAYYKHNSFKEDVILKEELDITQSHEQLLMQSIEYELGKLKLINEDDERKLRKEFDFILNNYSQNSNTNINVELSINNLISFRHKINYYLLFNSNIEPNNYLDDKYKEILNNIGENNSTISINDIDYYYELFIKYGNGFFLKDQNIVLKKIASLYIVKVKEENLNEEDIINSHFMDLIQYISVELNYYGNDIEELVNIIKEKNNTYFLKIGK